MPSVVRRAKDPDSKEGRERERKRHAAKAHGMESKKKKGSVHRALL